MTEKVDELALPSAVIMRILKDAIPDGINVSREARAAVARAAAIFVLYTTASASQVQATSQRKTLSATDVFLALEDMLFEDMIDPIKESLNAYHAEKGKKDSSSTSPTKSSSFPKAKKRRSQSTTAVEPETANVILEASSCDLQCEEIEIGNSSTCAD
ncbi:DNA polymerase epsilon subunit 3, partial [Stegodyphus mimosarum]